MGLRSSKEHTSKFYIIKYLNFYSIIESTLTLLNRPQSKLGQSCPNSWHKIDRRANRRCTCFVLLWAMLTPLKWVFREYKFPFWVCFWVQCSLLLQYEILEKLVTFIQSYTFKKHSIIENKLICCTSFIIISHCKFKTNCQEYIWKLVLTCLNSGCRK